MQTREQQVKLLDWAFKQANKAGYEIPNQPVREYALFVGNSIRQELAKQPPDFKPYGGTREEVTAFADALIAGEFDAELTELFNAGHGG